jgi:hypothetical protein
MLHNGALIGQLAALNDAYRCSCHIKTCALILDRHPLLTWIARAVAELSITGRVDPRVGSRFLEILSGREMSAFEIFQRYQNVLKL